MKTARPLLTALSLLLPCGGALAADLTTWETIPASACEPVAYGDKLQLTGGAWEFAPGQSGSVTLRCPVRSAHFFVDGGQVTHDLEANSLAAYFHDPDGVGDDYRITLRLRRSDKNDTSSSAVGDLFVPNDAGAEDYEEKCISFGCPLYDFVDALYVIEVVLTRDDVEANPHLTAVGLRTQVVG